MMVQRSAAPPPPASIGPMTLILSAIGCFAIGFAALMLSPVVWPRYVQAPVRADAAPAAPMVIQPQAPEPRVDAPSPLVTDIGRAGAAPEPQAIGTASTFAGLAECKANLRAGESYRGRTADQVAAALGVAKRSLTGAQIDAACRLIMK